MVAGRCSLRAMKRWFWLLDLLVVVSFVVIGRDSHGFANDLAETSRVALPFILALSMGIGTVMAWTDPVGWLAGIGIAFMTVIGGLLLRRYLFDGGVATTFVLLTTGWMIAWMVGWRLVYMLIARSRSRVRTAT